MVDKQYTGKHIKPFFKNKGGFGRRQAIYEKASYNESVTLAKK